MWITLMILPIVSLQPPSPHTQSNLIIQSCTARTHTCTLTGTKSAQTILLMAFSIHHSTATALLFVPLSVQPVSQHPWFKQEPRKCGRADCQMDFGG